MESEYAEKTERQSAVEQIKITEVISLTLKRWPWILLSLTVCIGLALLYLARATPVYTRTAAVVIKDESQGNSASASLDAFADMGLLQTHNNIVDEVNKLQSPDVMEEVVKRLSLNKTYTEPGDFRSEILYGPTLPVSVTMLALTENEGASFDIEVNKDGTFEISDVMVDKKDQRIIGASKKEV